MTAGGDILRPVLLPGTYRPPSGQVFAAIAEAEGGITGTIDSIQGTPTLIWHVVYHPTTVDLVLTGRDYTNPAIGLSPNRQALGRLFNSASDSATGDLAWVLNNLDYLESPASVKDAYRQMTPEKAAALSALSLRSASFLMQEQARRLIDQRVTGSTGPGASGLTVRYRSGGPVMLASASDDLSGLLAPKSSPDTPRGFYLRPLVTWGREGTTADQTGYRFTTAGFTTGFDYRVSDKLTLGASTGFTRTEARFTGSGGTAEAKTLPLSVYGLYGGTPWYAYGSLGYALNLYTLKRDIRFGGIDRTAQSDTTGHQINAYGEAGYDLKTGRLVVTPMVSMSYSGLWIDRYRERGAGALNLTVDAQRADSLQSGCGLRLSLPVTGDRATLIPQVFATYQHEYANGTRNIRATLNQAGTFTFRTDGPKQDFVTAGAKVSLVKGPNLYLDLDYTTDLGRGSSTSHALSAGVRWRF